MTRRVFPIVSNLRCLRSTIGFWLRLRQKQAIRSRCVLRRRTVERLAERVGTASAVPLLFVWQALAGWETSVLRPDRLAFTRRIPSLNSETPRHAGAGRGHPSRLQRSAGESGPDSV